MGRLRGQEGVGRGGAWRARADRGQRSGREGVVELQKDGLVGLGADRVVVDDGILARTFDDLELAQCLQMYESLKPGV